MANKIKIKHETNPTRCEVCHQTDLFDADENHCRRCDSLKTQLMPTETLLPDSEMNRIERVIRYSLVVLAFIGVVWMCSLSLSALLPDNHYLAGTITVGLVLLLFAGVIYFAPKLANALYHRFID